MDALQESILYIRSKITVSPQIALVLGSGLGDFGSLIKNPVIIPTKEIPHYPISTVQGHAGKLIFGRIEFEGKVSPELVIFQGRVHFYESNNLRDVIFPVQVAAGLGATIFFVTNAAGGINHQFLPGDLMFIRDHINLTGENPLIDNPSAVATDSSRFMDLSLLKKATTLATDLHIPYKEGVYLWTKGPSYESAAEIRMMSSMGADAVGMSTVPEIIAAYHLKMKVIGISCITNLATGISATKLSHGEVTETANLVKDNFTKLVSAILVHI